MIMKRTGIAALALCFAMEAAAAAEVFPRVTTRDLNGREMTFPDDLPGDPAVILIAFKRAQQADLDQWIGALALDRDSAPWIEMPIVPDYGSLWRGFVDNGMRSGIKTDAARSKVFTVYGPVDAIRQKLDFPTDDRVYLLVVRRNGTIVAQASGTVTPEKATRIADALK